nr:uncharacterized protein LOC127303015 [Lolium perenne]
MVFMHAQPDVISPSFISITSLLNGVPGSGFLNHAINLYLRCLGGLRFVLFRVEGTHKLPPTTLSPRNMVCVRTCNNQVEVGTSCVQSFVHNLREDGCSVIVSLNSRPGDPTFSMFSGKSLPVDKIKRWLMDLHTRFYH